MKLKPDVPYAEGEPLKDLEAKLGRGHYKRLPVVTGREDNTLSLVTSGRETFVTLLENFKRQDPSLQTSSASSHVLLTSMVSAI